MRADKMVPSFVTAIATVLLVGCAAGTPVREYFAIHGYSYPLHTTLKTHEVVTKVVCPGCEEAERPATESERRLLEDGLSFVAAAGAVDALRQVIPEGEAFQLFSSYLFEDPPGAPLGVAVEVAVFEAGPGIGEIHGPHEVHQVGSTQVLELRNILIFRETEGGWEYSGAIY